jgi:hypothetical protein
MTLSPMTAPTAATAETLLAAARAVLGGGHETAWGTFLGLAWSQHKSSIGIINVFPASLWSMNMVRRSAAFGLLHIV